MESQTKAQNNSTTTSNNSNNEWVSSGRVFRCCRNDTNIILSRDENMFNVLAEFVDEGMKCNESKKDGNSKMKMSTIK